jgi:protein gp37
MNVKTSIEWTDGKFNGWIGCTKVGPGCDHCYAEVLNSRFNGGNWGPGATRARTRAENWQELRNWNKRAGNRLFVECSACGTREFRRWDKRLPPGGLSCCTTKGCRALSESESTVARPRIFSASMSDWLDNEVPIEWFVDMLALIRETPNLDWLLLSKRIGRFNDAMHDAHRYVNVHQISRDLFEWLNSWVQGVAPANVWVGATIVNQEEANRDIPKLMAVPARIRFLSCEPMLGAIDLNKIQNTHTEMHMSALHRQYDGNYYDSAAQMNWVICGGESGGGARPMNADWCRSLRDQCAEAGVPFFMKQMGGLRKSVMPAIPPDLFIRQFPESVA